MTETATEDSSDKEDPQHTGGNAGSMSATSDDGASADETQILSASSVAENSKLTFGIDVSKYQGTIKWDKVAAGGIDFAMIRVGYRTQKTGEMCVDTNARYNMQEAQKNGIKVGVYFFSSAVNETEAIEEADWVADYISKYQITYPVAFDCEGFTDSASRQYGMSSEARTKVAEAFLQEIYNKGYTPMFYAAMSCHKTASGILKRWRADTKYGCHNIRIQLIHKHHSHHMRVHMLCGSIPTRERCQGLISR